MARREESLSRESIIEASIQLLDERGEAGLTFRALAQRLETGAGAIYWHVANKSDLLTAACDTIVARALEGADLPSLALGLFDAIEKRPWVGAALTQSPGGLPGLRIFDRIGGHVRALRVPAEKQWPVASALLNYILGVSGQNAANARFARERGLRRTEFLESVAVQWSNAAEFPFAQSMAENLGTHDDRADFLTGIALILRGVENH